MLVSKTGKNGNTEFCDAIVYTDNPESWGTLLSEANKKKGCITTRSKLQIKGHYQLLWHKNEDLAVTVSVYKNKIMAQPGQKDLPKLLD